MPGDCAPLPPASSDLNVVPTFESVYKRPHRSTARPNAPLPLPLRGACPNHRHAFRPTRLPGYPGHALHVHVPTCIHCIGWVPPLRTLEGHHTGGRPTRKNKNEAMYYVRTYCHVNLQVAARKEPVPGRLLPRFHLGSRSSRLALPLKGTGCRRLGAWSHLIRPTSSYWRLAPARMTIWTSWSRVLLLLYQRVN